MSVVGILILELSAIYLVACFMDLIIALFDILTLAGIHSAVSLKSTGYQDESISLFSPSWDRFSPAGEGALCHLLSFGTP